MNDLSHTQPDGQSIHRVAAGEDLYGEYRGRGVGVSTISFKVTSPDPNGLLVVENTLYKKRGPVRHLHYDQDEWFYCVEGEFIFEIGPERMSLSPGDSILAPRKVPHVWAFIGGTQGRILIAFMPAGNMEAYYREVLKANTLLSQDPAFWRAYGMEWLGPPLPID